jgi:hypothetical protein
MDTENTNDFLAEDAPNRETSFLGMGVHQQALSTFGCLSRKPIVLRTVILLNLLLTASMTRVAIS